MKPYYELKNDKVSFNLTRRKQTFDKIKEYDEVINNSNVNEDFFGNDYVLKNQKNLIELKNRKKVK